MGQRRGACPRLVTSTLQTQCWCPPWPCRDAVAAVAASASGMYVSRVANLLSVQLPLNSEGRDSRQADKAVRSDKVAGGFTRYTTLYATCREKPRGTPNTLIEIGYGFKSDKY